MYLKSFYTSHRFLLFLNDFPQHYKQSLMTSHFICFPPSHWLEVVKSKSSLGSFLETLKSELSLCSCGCVMINFDAPLSLPFFLLGFGPFGNNGVRAFPVSLICRPVVGSVRADRHGAWGFL